MLREAWDALGRGVGLKLLQRATDINRDCVIRGSDRVVGGVHHEQVLFAVNLRLRTQATLVTHSGKQALRLRLQERQLSHARLLCVAHLRLVWREACSRAKSAWVNAASHRFIDRHGIARKHSQARHLCLYILDCNWIQTLVHGRQRHTYQSHS